MIKENLFKQNTQQTIDLLQRLIGELKHSQVMNFEMDKHAPLENQISSNSININYIDSGFRHIKIYLDYYVNKENK